MPTGIWINLGLCAVLLLLGLFFATWIALLGGLIYVVAVLTALVAYRWREGR